MTDEQIRLAIAESVGIRKGKVNFGCFQSHKWEYDTGGGAYMELDAPPDYPNDLNAMHEATKDFDMWTTVKFSDQLKRIIQDEKCIESAIDARYLTVNATARQRAEAYLRVKGLWKE